MQILSKQIDLGKSGFTVRDKTPEKVYKGTALGYEWEVRDSMWLEGLFEEDPGTYGLAGMKHSLLCTAPNGDQAVFENLFLQGITLWWDYYPSVFRKGPEGFLAFQNGISTLYAELCQEKGLWADNYSASRWALQGPRSCSRGLPYAQGTLPPNSDLTEIYLLQRFYQRTYVPDQNGKPASAHLRWYTKIFDWETQTCYGDLVTLHDEAAKEYRLLDCSNRIPQQLVQPLFVRLVQEHQDFIESLGSEAKPEDAC